MSQTDDPAAPLRVHRPAASDVDEPENLPVTGPRWLFDGVEAPAKPAVPVTPGVMRGLVLAFLLFVVALLVVRATLGGRGQASPAQSLPSVSPTVSASAGPLPTATATATATATPTTSPSAITAVPIAPPVTSDGDSTSAPDLALAAWYEQDGQPLLNEMGSVVDQMQSDLVARDTDELRADCVSLGNLSDEAQSHRPPSAEEQIASDWDDAADAAAQSSADCVNGVDNDDAAQLRSAIDTAQEAVQYARAVVAGVDERI